MKIAKPGENKGLSQQEGNPFPQSLFGSIPLVKIKKAGQL
jgi:hypothetical protein